MHVLNSVWKVVVEMINNVNFLSHPISGVATVLFKRIHYKLMQHLTSAGIAAFI